MSVMDHNLWYTIEGLFKINYIDWLYLKTKMLTPKVIGIENV